MKQKYYNFINKFVYDNVGILKTLDMVWKKSVKWDKSGAVGTFS